MCELRTLTYSGRAFQLVHTIQKVSSEARETDWYSFNNQKGFMMAIEKRFKFKNWNYTFLFIHSTGGWAHVQDWNNNELIRNPLVEPTGKKELPLDISSIMSERMTD